METQETLSLKNIHDYKEIRLDEFHKNTKVKTRHENQSAKKKYILKEYDITGNDY